MSRIVFPVHLSFLDYQIEKELSHSALSSACIDCMFLPRISRVCRLSENSANKNRRLHRQGSAVGALSAQLGYTESKGLSRCIICPPKHHIMREKN